MGEAPRPQDIERGAELLRVEDAWKIYDMGEVQIEALRGVSLTVRAGDYVAIMGQSGSGKSTLLNLLGCLDRPTQGEVYLAGRPVADLEDDELADVRLHWMGFVFQSFHLLPRRSALDQVMLPLVYARRSDREGRAIAALEQVGLGERLDHVPSQLSGGQAQRVAIARAIVNEPRIILADEPTGALDTRSGAEIMDILDGLNERGITVILVTHEAHIAVRARRVLRFLDGEIVADAEGAEVDGVVNRGQGATP
jgi:putative ABC transport system ATP-binding protein